MVRARYRLQGQELTLDIHDDAVFVPNLVSLFTACQARIRPGETVCDVGCGSGLIAIMAAKLGARKVYGIDINPAAETDFLANVRLNGVEERCVFLRGSYFEPLRRQGLRCDLAVSTMPNVRAEQASAWSGGENPSLRHSVAGGEDGEDSKVALIREARSGLAPGGRMVLSNVGWCNPERCLVALSQEGFHVCELACSSIPDWGAGNNMRAWLASHPGEHRFEFSPSRDPASKAAILEARLDAGGPARAPDGLPSVEVLCPAPEP
jgi:methylase of polypeptide subunit release factors